MPHAFPMPRVYSYTRFSTPEQASGDSARRQMDAARLYAREHGLELDESLTIRDLGVSAFKGANLDPRAGLGRFMEAVQTGLVEPGSVLLLESLDRLSRTTARKAVRILEDIVDEGVTVVTLSDNQRYDKARLDGDPLAFLFAYTVAMRAHEESATKGRRVAAAWAEKRRKVRGGEAVKLTRQAPAWLQWTGERWEVDGERAEIVRRVFELAGAGVGDHSIAERFNKERVAPLGRASRWHRSSVAKLLANRSVLGELVPGRIEHLEGRRVRVLEEPITGAFPAIIEEAQWLAVRSLKDGHAPAVRGRGAKQPLANLLAGLARCPVCGDVMTRVNKGNASKGGRPKLVCTRAKIGAGCVYHGVPLDEVEAALLERPAWLVESIPAGGAGSELDSEAERLRGTIAGLEDHLAELQEATAGAITPRAAAERLTRLGCQLDTARAELDAVQERRRLVDGGLVHDRALRLGKAIIEFNGEHREPINAAMRVLFEGITVDYPEGRLLFQWRQGGVSVVPYAFRFADETDPA